MGSEWRIQLGENKGDKYTTWREQGRHVRKQMADEKNQGSQQAPRKKKSKREREKETKKERKERKKGTKWRQQGRQVRKQTMDKEHPMSILCAGSTQREQQQRRKKCQNKLRTSRETGAETDETQRESFPQSNQNKEHWAMDQQGRQAQKQVENKENFASQTYPEKRIAIDREVRKQVWDNKGNEHGNKWETKRRRVSCAQKHPGRRTVTGMDKRNGERRTATQMKDSGMFIAPKHLEVLKPRHTWETRRILGPKST